MTALDDAWQQALAAEHQAVFGYPLAGVHLTGTQRTLALTCETAHGAERDGVEAAMAAAGLTPVGSAVDYPALYPVGDARQARALAVRLEQACCAAWRFVYVRAVADPAVSRTGSPAATLRTQAQQQLTAGTVRAVQWRRLTDPAHASVAFPGI